MAKWNQGEGTNNFTNRNAKCPKFMYTKLAELSWIHDPDRDECFGASPFWVGRGSWGVSGGCPTDTIVESNSGNRLSSLCVSLDGRKAKDEDDAQ